MGHVEQPGGATVSRVRVPHHHIHPAETNQEASMMRIRLCVCVRMCAQ